MLYWTDHNGRRWPVCSCLKEWLTAYQNELLRRRLIHTCIDVFQTIGNAQASAGTHSKGGCADLGQTSREQLRVARNMGAAAWERDDDPNDGQPNFDDHHSHLSLKGCPHAVQYARDQVDDLEDGFNGLGVLEDHRGAPDDGPRTNVRWPLRDWRQGIAWAKSEAAAKPAAVDIRNQKLTTDIEDDDGDALEVKQPALATYDSDSFHRLPDGAIRMRVHKGGATTSGSTKPRTELREMRNEGKDLAAWSNRSGSHVQSETIAVTHLDKGASVVISQIHDELDDVVMIRATGLGEGYVKLEAGLGLGKGNGNDWKLLSAQYRIGLKFKLTTYATREGIAVKLNNVEKARWSSRVRRSDKCYWKAGAYLQAGDWAEIVLYGLTEVAA